MKSRSNSSNKAEKQVCEVKTVIKIKYSSLKTGCDLCLERLSYKTTKKLFKKTDKAQKPKYVFKKPIFSKVITNL